MPGHVEGCRAHAILDSGMASVPTLNSFLNEKETLCLSQYSSITQHSINNRNEIAHSNLGNLRIVYWQGTKDIGLGRMVIDLG